MEPFVDKPQMKIAYATDSHFSFLCAVSMASVLKNTPEADIEFIILHSELDEKSRITFSRLATIRECSFRYIQMDEACFTGLSTNWTIQAWFRCNMFVFCPDLDKILYLDCDTLVLESLVPLWNTNLDGHLVGAVQDVIYKKMIKHVSIQTDWYFNSGVLLFNAKRFREEQLFEKIRELGIRNREKFHSSDQDTLNQLVNGDLVQLPMKYNYMEVWFQNGHYDYEGETEALYLEARKHPTIVHFTNTKPDHINCRHSMRFYWWEYARLLFGYEERLLNFVQQKTEKRKYYLFSWLPLLKVKEKNGVRGWYLFGFLPIMKREVQNGVCFCSLFGCIPFLKYKI